jgi:hypothetical protein
VRRSKKNRLTIGLIQTEGIGIAIDPSWPKKENQRRYDRIDLEAILIAAVAAPLRRLVERQNTKDPMLPAAGRCWRRLVLPALNKLPIFCMYHYIIIHRTTTGD